MPKNYDMQKLSSIKEINNIENINELMSMKRSTNINNVQEESSTFGDKVADIISSFAGSWPFIISFAIVLFLWISLNSLEIFFKAFDPYPYILLNLILSCISALQAPIIMMSQKRQDYRDRIKADKDYELNLKNEILIEQIVKKLSEIEEVQENLLKNQLSIFDEINTKNND